MRAMIPPSMRLAPSFVVVLVATLAPSGHVLAHSGGQPGGGCVGCHGGGDLNISVSTSPSSVDPGEQITVTVSISGGPGSVAGMFLEADVGQLATIGGQGLEEVSAGLTHSSPKSMGGGAANFSFLWTAPNSPGAVRFSIWALSANGNGGSSGDKGDDIDYDVVFGCSSQQYFLDLDGDGYGRDAAPKLDCAGAMPDDYAAAGGDCDDTRDSVHPGAAELCNQRDDDCDEQIDEDAIPIELFPDGDGDGYYGQVEGESTDTVIGCVGTPGYGGEPGDCEPTDPNMHPGAEEVCNLYDDNCDGRVDERVRPQCGEGWCTREAWTCDAENCTPGEPQPEVCNLLDDDCDGDVDEDVACPGGTTCIAGECRVAGSDDGGVSGGGSGGDGNGDGATSSNPGSGPTSGGGDAAADGSGGGCRAHGRPASLLALALVFVLGALRRRRSVA